jgi:hypothetical protein
VAAETEAKAHIDTVLQEALRAADRDERAAGTR